MGQDILYAAPHGIGHTLHQKNGTHSFTPLSSSFIPLSKGQYPMIVADSDSDSEY